MAKILSFCSTRTYSKSPRIIMGKKQLEIPTVRSASKRQVLPISLLVNTVAKRTELLSVAEDTCSFFFYYHHATCLFLYPLKISENHRYIKNFKNLRHIKIQPIKHIPKKVCDWARFRVKSRHLTKNRCVSGAMA